MERNSPRCMSIIKGKKVTWRAELSIVENSNGSNNRLITFSWGFKLRRFGRPKAKDSKSLLKFQNITK